MQTFIIVVGIVAVMLPQATLAIEYVVGDANGWRIGVDYAAWAQGKEFHVGDALVFKYIKILHSVAKVNETAFQACNIPPRNETLMSGNDIVALDTPGNKWYICGIPNHCNRNQKLAINVLTTPAPPPSSN